MKKLAKALVAFSFICVFTVPAFAVLITFDENGNIAPVTIYNPFAVDADGIIYVADRQNGRLQRFDLNGRYLGEWANLGMVTTVAIRGDGLGGRNQEFALAAAIEIDGLEGVVVLSGGTDGTDGPTDAAGGIVDWTTVQRARAKGLDARSYLERNDSYPFLKTVGDLLITGPTLTNVMDLRLVLIV